MRTFVDQTRLIVGIAALFLALSPLKDTAAQSCSGGTTTISTAEDSTQVIRLSDSCLVVTSSGSISPPSASQLIYTDSDIDQQLNGISITNNGTISYSLVDDYSRLTAINNRRYTTLSSLENSGTIDVSLSGLNSITSGIRNEGNAAITLLTNSGTIAGTATGLDSFGGIGIENYGSIATLINSGTISGNVFGINNDGTISALTNTGTTSGGSFGIFNTGQITTITNSNLISSTNSGVAIYNLSGFINTLINNGSIAANSDYSIAIFNDMGRIEVLTNNSTLTSGNYGRGIENYEGQITILRNAGGITVGNNGYGIDSGDNSSITTLSNSGSITVGNSGRGIFNSRGSSIATLNNSGTITAGDSGWGIGNFNLGNITAFNNTGTISVGANGFGINNYGTNEEGTGGIIVTLNNYGTISAGASGIGISNTGTFDEMINFTIPGTAGNITTLNNYGTISAGNLGRGISNTGTINLLSNSGTISAGEDGYGIYNDGLINTLTNTGTIAGRIFITCADLATDCDAVTKGSGRINTLNNSGTISGDVVLWMPAPTPGALPSIGTLNNSGSMSSIYLQYLVGQGVAIEALNNTGQINNGIQIIGVMSDSSAGIGTLRNSGSIYGGVQIGFVGVTGLRSGTGIQSFINTGSVTGGIDISGILYIGAPQSGIELLTNMGSITGGIAVSSISSGSVGIITLNNLQGGASSPALTYSGMLPTNYNIIINSANQYGQLAVTSPIDTITNFGIYGAPFITSRTYAGVLSGTALPSGISSGTYDNMTWALVENGADVYDLTFSGVSLRGTQQSLANTASVLQGTFTLQNSVMVNGFTYDCTLFDQRGICVSAGGRNTTVQAQGVNNTSGLLIASYRLDKNNSRIGAWVDQNLSVSGPGTVKLGNSTPMIGLFGVWSQRPDGVGAEVKVSAAYGQKNTTITRQIVGLSEPGSGSSQLISQGAQVVAKYGFAVMPDVVVSPYAGVRYTQNNMGGYTEATTSAVTAPLTYSALNTNATTALAGAEARYRGIPRTTLFASAGVETDTNTSNGSYSATGITGLTPVNFNPNPVKTRPTATAGAYYDIMKNQRIGVTGIYRQEPYQAVSTTTVLATYTIGL